MVEQGPQAEKLLSEISDHISRRKLLEALLIIPVINLSNLPAKLEQISKIVVDLCRLLAVNSPYSQSPLPSLDQLRHQSIENQAVNSRLERDLNKLIS